MKYILMFFCIFVSSNTYCQTWFGWMSNSTFTFDSVGVPYQGYLEIDTIHYHYNNWVVGKPNKPVFDSSFSPYNAIVTDTVHPYRAHDTSVFTLKVPKVVTASPTYLWPGLLSSIEFYYQLNIDSNAKADFDISEDNGLHWINLRDTLPTGYYWLDSPANLNTSTVGWHHFNLKLKWFYRPPYSDSTLFRFTFIADSNTLSKDGWIIDNIHFNIDWWESVPQIQNDNLISIYPNPSKGNIYIHANDGLRDKSSIKVYNMLGQEVYTTENTTSDCLLYLPLPEGIYTLKYMQDNQFCVKSVLIEK